MTDKLIAKYLQSMWKGYREWNHNTYSANRYLRAVETRRFRAARRAFEGTDQEFINRVEIIRQAIKEEEK